MSCKQLKSISDSDISQQTQEGLALVRIASNVTEKTWKKREEKKPSSLFKLSQIMLLDFTKLSQIMHLNLAT
jgi:hypothetical protein